LVTKIPPNWSGNETFFSITRPKLAPTMHCAERVWKVLCLFC
jgi:hypothetical protein